MARKNVIKTFDIFDSVDISTNQTSVSTDTSNLDKASIYVSWTGDGSLSGTLEIEATNDDPENSLSEWRTLTFSTAITISGVSGSHDIVFTELPFRSMRVKYNSSAGTGSLNATLTAKTVGA